MSEYLLAEKRCIDELTAIGWSWMKPTDNEAARDGLNQVILRDEFTSAISRINGIDLDAARATYSDVINIRDNEAWTKVLRGEYNRSLLIAVKLCHRDLRHYGAQGPVTLLRRVLSTPAWAKERQALIGAPVNPKGNQNIDDTQAYYGNS